MASAAAILFVRNDVDDIGWWISYHLALKFDALIVIDDHSTDGTWEVIQAAADLYPIEARRGSVPDGRSSASAAPKRSVRPSKQAAPVSTG